MTEPTGYYAHIDSSNVDDRHQAGTVSIFSPEGTDETVIGRVTGPTPLADANRLIRSAGWVTVGRWDGVETGFIARVARPISAEEMDQRVSFGPAWAPQETRT